MTDLKEKKEVMMERITEELPEIQKKMPYEKWAPKHYRIKFGKWFHGKKKVYPGFLLSLSYGEMKINYETRNAVSKNKSIINKKDISQILKKSLRKNGINADSKKEVISFARDLVNIFFLKLEDEMIRENVAFLWPSKLQYLFFCRRKYATKGRYVTKIRFATRFYAQFITQKYHRVPSGYFFGSANPKLAKRIRETEKIGRDFATHDEYLTHIKGELRYGQQLKIHRPKGDFV